MKNWKEGERLFKSKWDTDRFEIIDVSNNSNYFSKDIDFIATRKSTNETRTFEVKWDSNIARTNNLFVEVYNEASKGSKGWFEFCEADFIAYGDAVNEVFYLIKLEDLKDYLSFPKGIREVVVPVGEKDKRMTKGLLVNLNKFRELYEVIEVGRNSIFQ